MSIVPHLPDSSRPIGIYIPKGVSLPADPFFAAYKEDALYFLHLIFRQRIFKKRHRDDFVPLKQAYLKQQMDQLQVKPIIDRLIIAGVVECDGTFICGKKSLGYRLRQDLRSAEHERYTLSDNRLLRRLKRWHEKGQDIAPSVPVHVGLKERFDLLTVDSSAALRDVEAYYQSTWTALKGIRSATRKRTKARDKRNAERHAIDAWVNGNCFFHIDDFGRIHTNLANLSSRLRKYVSLQGEPLYEIDLCNSQPLILACLMIRFYQNDKKSFSKDENESFDFKSDLLRFLDRLNKTKAKATTTHPSTIPSHNDDILGGIKLPEDGMEYVRLCQTGTLYEETLPKKEFFKSMFGKELPVFVKDRFPSLSEVVRFAKYDDYRHLAHMLQRTEAKIMIHGAAGRLIEKGKFVATIHDSLIVRKTDINRAIRYVVEEFDEWKIVPKYRVKRLTCSKAASRLREVHWCGIVPHGVSESIPEGVVGVRERTQPA